MNPYLQHLFPILKWSRKYQKSDLSNDLIAAVIVTIMLIPQSLAYALLAGLPPEMGIYASIVPIVLYCIFGSSRTLAVGPVAIISLMTATAIGDVSVAGTQGYITAALTLAALSGAMLLLMGLFRLGFIANFLSHPVISGFITASGILIAASQLKYLLGIQIEGHSLIDLTIGLFTHFPEINLMTSLIGISSAVFLLWVRKWFEPMLLKMGVPARVASVCTQIGPVLAVVLTTGLTWVFRLDLADVQVIGDVPQSLPPFTMPGFSSDLVMSLWMPALLISIIGFVESVSVAQTLAAKRRQKIDPNQELVGLGAANLGAAFTGGFPVTGGLSRSVVNFDAGAKTPAAGAYTALVLTVAGLFLTPLIFFLPKATLAAIIIVAVLSLVDFGMLGKAWRYSKADFIAVTVTILSTLTLSIEIGVSTGVALSIALFLYRTSKPHIAELGLITGTQHFRNVLRHQVVTDPAVFMMRIDQSLYFANARYLEDYIYERVIERPIKHVVIMCSAVNEIDMSALESLESINARLGSLGIQMHLSEIKGPVMDRLACTEFFERLTGQVYLSQYEAFSKLSSKR